MKLVDSAYYCRAMSKVAYIERPALLFGSTLIMSFSANPCIHTSSVNLPLAAYPAWSSSWSACMVNSSELLLYRMKYHDYSAV
jgi:hypothetical protein